MAYFDCIVGGSGKGNTVAVTCAEEFAGLTITLSKTGKTYTKTCPSTAPYVVTFYGVENGTYTVSCTVDGQTYSETVIVQDISCVLNYGFNWRVWVDTASQLDSSDYNSLDEVLEDEKALRELFLEHACVDYMASIATANADVETIINNDLCAKWINLSDYALDYLYANEIIADLMDEADKYGYGEWALMPQVPTMTSNTVPYGTASASDIYPYQTSYAWYVFDGNDTTRWISDGREQIGNKYIQYEFPSKIAVQQISILANYEGGHLALKNFTLQGSDDGTTFEDIYTGQTVDENREQVFSFTNNKAYKIWRLFCADVWANYVSIYTLQFYAWAPKGNVPVMTSNTAPYGTASASSIFNTERQAWCGFQKGTVQYGWTTAANASNPWLRYKFTNPVNAKKARVEVWKDDTTWTAKFKIQGSNDGTNFVDVSDEVSIAPNTSGTVGDILEVDINTTAYYLYYQIKFSTVIITGGGNFYAFKLQLYGRELKVSVPVMTSNTAPYGEAFASSHGDSLPWKAFDKNSSTAWFTAPNTYSNQTITYAFSSDVCVKKVHFISYSSSVSLQRATTIHVQASKNNATYTDLATFNSPSANANANVIIDISNNNEAYKYYQLKYDSYSYDSSGGGGGKYCTAEGIQFYGLDYSEKEFEVGTTKKWLYDHGVNFGLEGLTAANGYSMSSYSLVAPTFDNEYVDIVASSTGANTFCGAGCVVDDGLINNNLAFARVDGLSVNSSVYGRLRVYISKTLTNANAPATVFLPSPQAGGDILGLDISNISNGLVVVFENYVTTGTMSARLYELWLE